GCDGRARRRHSWSGVSRSSTVQPPPWKYTVTGSLASELGRYQRSGIPPNGPGTRSFSTFAIAARGGSTTNWRRLARLASATGKVKRGGTPEAFIASSSDWAWGSSCLIWHPVVSAGGSAASIRATGRPAEG